MTQETTNWEFAEGSQGIEQHCHSEPVRTTFVGISIESRAAHRHTGRFILPFSGAHPREIVLLSRRLPRQCALLYRNDREFDGARLDAVRVPELSIVNCQLSIPINPRSRKKAAIAPFSPRALPC